ncbi:MULTISPECIES: TnsD family Tn7-like transposition protein [unclassified Vibrio]|uniref:TnsD family Tn7-like transposition protein n=1 Tax=unclassified Vibrio TaxID=2614977 RepID=UPI0021CEC8CB|nr:MULTISPECIES: TnsD family transposase [unclassified Vibrio]MDW1591485.1 TnsD family Tn7-like transposition protein [Vibrio sp. Vb2944]MDW1608088.1 TnsD family Tn7-like transposition protein [Vibrio sp. Vb2908]MDW1724889.1 TnsD family Tn7-like transposition protein [Vibrio sp. Vb2909]
MDSRFSFFPNPIEDETVYSWLTRYHLMSGNRSFRANTLDMLDVHEGRASNEFPSYLPSLSKMASYPLHLIASEMTPFHYYSPFLRDELREQVWTSLNNGSTNAIQSKIGGVASRLTPGQYLYSCRYCVAEDIENHGFPIWHLTHQLLGVEVCPIHHEHLRRTKRIKSLAQLPEPIAEPDSNALEDRYASLIQEEVSSHTNSLDSNQIMEAYYQRFKEAGFTTNAGRLRLRSLRQLLLSHLSSFPVGFQEYDFIRQQIELHRYPECLFYNSDATHHPLKHLILIEILFSNWADFTTELTTPHEPISLKALSPMIQPNKKELSKQGEQSLKNGESLRSVSKTENLCVSTLKILAQQKQIVTDCRPSKIFPDMEKDIVRRLTLGAKTTEIAPIFNISVGAIEQILRKHPQLVQLRKRIRFLRKKSKHRISILNCQKEHPSASRQEIRQMEGAAYTWLYKNDSQWLYKTLPSAIPREERSKINKTTFNRKK